MQKKNIQPRYKMGMSVDEFDRLYLEDIQTHQRRFIYRQKEIMRICKKATKFPIRYTVREQHGREEFRGYMDIHSKNQIFTDGVDVDSVILFKNSRGTCAYINADPYNVVGQRLVFTTRGAIGSHRYLFTPHFFERYEMRHGWEVGFSDIYNQFFYRNFSFKGGCFYTCASIARPGDYKTIDFWSLCEDGVMLGQVHGDESAFKDGKPYVMQFNTFLDFDTLTRRQDKYYNIMDDMKRVFRSLPEQKESPLSLVQRTFVTNLIM